MFVRLVVARVPESLLAWINQILRAVGTKRTCRLDQERTETYAVRFSAKEYLKVQKVTSLIDHGSVIVVTVSGQTVLVWGDAFNQAYIPGSWELWLQRRVQELRDP